MRLFFPLITLFLAVILMQIAMGGLGPLDALSGYQLEFSLAQIGLLGSAQFAGFIIGCWASPIMIGTFGHLRVLAAFIGFGIIGILLHVVILDPYYWAFFRLLSGVSIAGIYTVVESWLQAKATNKTRGRIMGGYRLADLFASLAAQILLGFLEPAAYISYNILAIILCIAIFPVLFSRMPQPTISISLKLRLRPLLPFRYSPLGAVTVIVSGFTTSAFRMISPIYGNAINLTIEQIGFFLASFMLGGALAQYPLGAIADRVDRRIVIIGLSIGAILSSFANIMLNNNDIFFIYFCASAIGFMTFPIYSIAIAHTNDFCTDEERVDMSAALLFLFGIGAVISPLLTAQLIEYFGPKALFVFIAFIHVLLILYSIIRRLMRPVSKINVPYIYMPRTSFVLGKILRFRNEKSTPNKKDTPSQTK